jgi:hypothetical protein
MSILWEKKRMSSDNSVLILHTSDGYRIAHIQGMGNAYWWPACCTKANVIIDEKEEDALYEYHEKCLNCSTQNPEWEERQEIYPKWVKDNFGNSKVYNTISEALTASGKLLEEIGGYCEYGIQFLKGYEGKDFPK